MDSQENEEIIEMAEGVNEMNLEDSESVIFHLRELVNCYEDLVQDMTHTIHKTRQDFITCQKESVGSEVIMTAESPCSSCSSCKNSQILVDNLKKQVDVLANGKKTVTALWHASAEQIEQLETRLKSKAVTPTDIQLKASTDNQVKFFQDYIIRLEARIEQSSSEKNFYRTKLMETKLEKEAIMKKLSYEKQKDIEVVKSTYLKEIEHLKQLLERERTFLQSAIEKKLEDERKIWIKQEKERREKLKKSWIDQLEPIVVEQEAVFYRETQLSDQLRQTQMELYQAKQILLMYQQQTQLNVHPSTQIENTKESANSKALAVTGEVEKRRVEDGNFTFELDKCGQLPYNMRSHNCIHEECVQYSMHQKVLQENERLGQEIDRLQRAKQVFEKEYVQHAQRLEQRIRDLENVNYKLQTQMLTQNYIHHRESVFNMKTSSGGGDVEDGRLVLEGNFSESQPQLMAYSSPIQMKRTFMEGDSSLDAHSKTTNNIKNNNSTIDKLERFSRDLGLRHKVNEEKWLIREQTFMSKLQSNKEEENRKLFMDPLLF